MQLPALRLASVFVLLVVFLGCALLPVPVRAQDGSGAQVQFPSSSSSCVTCQPAFGSSACQTILNSISLGSATTPISNTTLASCQCSSTFLSLYSSCVQCFTETNQLSLVFGSARAPTQASLQTYCNNANALGTTTTVTMTTVTVTRTTTSGKPTSTSNPSNPNSAVSFKVTAFSNTQSSNTVQAVLLLTAIFYIASLA